MRLDQLRLHNNEKEEMEPWAATFDNYFKYVVAAVVVGVSDLRS